MENRILSKWETFVSDTYSQVLFIKMNKEYKGNLVKRYMVCLFNKFVRCFFEQVQPTRCKVSINLISA